MTVIKVRVPTVRESQGILREAGEVRENREGQGIFRSLDQLFMYYFHNFCRLHPCKCCRLVYIAIFYNGTKFSITFV